MLLNIIKIYNFAIVKVNLVSRFSKTVRNIYDFLIHSFYFCGAECWDQDYSLFFDQGSI